MMTEDYKTPSGAAPPDWRALCEELLDALDGWHQAVFETGTGWVRPDETYLLDRARAALAEPGPEGPTDDSLKPCPFCGSPADLEDHRLCWYVRCSGCGACVMGDQAEEPEQDFPDSYWKQFRQSAVERWNRRSRTPDLAPAQPEPEAVGPTDEELLRMAAEAIDPYDTIGIGEYEAETECAVEAYGSELIAFARAVLARWGRPAPVPAEGEVTELVAWLRMYGATGRQVLDQTPWTASQLDRAADLLELHTTPVPVAMSERLPGPEDCDAEGRCWWGLEESDDYEACWTLRKMHGIPFDNTRWLPATALPLPQGEVRP